MINVITDLTHEIELLNNFIQKKMLSKNQLKQMHENMRDFKKIEQEMADLISQLDDTSHLERDELDLILAHLHFKVSHMAWHLSEMRELIEVVFGKYKKILNQIE